jgi:hypothetical protein
LEFEKNILEKTQLIDDLNKILEKVSFGLFKHIFKFILLNLPGKSIYFIQFK